MSSDFRSSFHDDLADVRIGVARLSAGVTELVPRATEILLGADLEGAEYLILGDSEYDAKSIELEERCFSLIVLQAPVANDLRELVSAVKIVADIERSADLCVNICKAARRIYSHSLDANLRGMIQKCGQQASLLFKETTEAYLARDGVRASALPDMDGYLDDLHRQFIQVIFESHAAGTIDLQVAVQLALVARFYERIGDHAVNVAERTRYIVDGWLPEHSGVEGEIAGPIADDQPPLSQD